MSYYYHDVRVVVVEKDKPVSRRVSVLLKFENLFNEARLSVTPMKLFLYEAPPCFLSSGAYNIQLVQLLLRIK